MIRELNYSLNALHTRTIVRNPEHLSSGHFVPSNPRLQTLPHIFNPQYLV